MSIYPSNAEQTDFAYNALHYFGTILAAAMIHERGWWLPLIITFAWAVVYYYFFHVRPAMHGLNELSEEELHQLELQNLLGAGQTDDATVRKVEQQARQLKRRLDSLEKKLDEAQ